jgi:hypothetical protein
VRALRRFCEQQVIQQQQPARATPFGSRGAPTSTGSTPAAAAGGSSTPAAAGSSKLAAISSSGREAPAAGSRSAGSRSSDSSQRLLTGWFKPMAATVLGALSPKKAAAAASLPPPAQQQQSKQPAASSGQPQQQPQPAAAASGQQPATASGQPAFKGPWDPHGFGLRKLDKKLAAKIFNTTGDARRILQAEMMAQQKADGHMSLDHVHPPAKRMKGGFTGTLIAMGGPGTVLGYWNVYSTSLTDVERQLIALNERQTRLHNQVRGAGVLGHEQASSQQRCQASHTVYAGQSEVAVLWCSHMPLTACAARHCPAAHHPGDCGQPTHYGGPAQQGAAGCCCQDGRRPRHVQQAWQAP